MVKIYHQFYSLEHTQCQAWEYTPAYIMEKGRYIYINYRSLPKQFIVYSMKGRQAKGHKYSWACSKIQTGPSDSLSKLLR